MAFSALRCGLLVLLAAAFTGTAYRQTSLDDEILQVTKELAGRDSTPVLVGTLNMLGDAFNPFEFLPFGDADAMAPHEVLGQKFRELAWSDVKPFVKDLLGTLSTEQQTEFAKLRRHCNAGAPCWEFFNEAVLDKDNKLTDNRINLLTMAMKKNAEEPGEDGWKMQWELASSSASWIAEMKKEMEVAEGSYAQDPRLLVWDVFCNAVASSASVAQAYTNICSGSFLNPSMYESVGNAFLSALDAGRDATSTTPSVLACQEFPAEGSERSLAYEKVLAEKNFKVFRGSGSTAFLLRGFEPSEVTVLTEEGLDPKAILESSLEDEGASDASEDDIKRLGNAATKVEVLKIRGTALILTHAKEPKTELCAVLLARYVLALGAAVQESFGVSSWVGFSDTNLAKLPFKQSFVEELEKAGAEGMPKTAATTSKRRSRLHGQCYDNKKSDTTVVAPKDVLMSSSPGSLTGFSIFPNIQDEAGNTLVTLPTPAWGSDHCLVSAVYSMPEA